MSVQEDESVAEEGGKCKRQIKSKVPIKSNSVTIS